MTKFILFAVFLFLACFTIIYYGYSTLYMRSLLLPGATSGPVVTFDGASWTQVFYWSFKDGFYPYGWGWGNWSLINGTLEGRDLYGEPSVYIIPFTHVANFVLETKVQFIHGIDILGVEAQVLTRDNNTINFESGVVLFAKENKITIRHMANKTDYVYESFDTSLNVTYGEWYVLRFLIHKGVIKALVNEVQVYVSNNSFSVGEFYHEPHLAVRYGVARFEYVKIFIAA